MGVNKLPKLAAKHNKITGKIGSIAVLLILKAQSGIKVIMLTSLVTNMELKKAMRTITPINKRVSWTLSVSENAKYLKIPKNCNVCTITISINKDPIVCQSISLPWGLLTKKVTNVTKKIINNNLSLTINLIIFIILWPYFWVINA